MSSSTTPDRPAAVRILLVDKNKGGSVARKAVLEEHGHRVATANNAEDALDHFTKTKFDLLITGHRMAKMNGIDLIKKIRGFEPRIPVILLSGYVDALGLTEDNTGADLVLAKGANEVTHLVRAVSRLLRQKATKKPPAVHRRLAAKARTV